MCVFVRDVAYVKNHISSCFLGIFIDFFSEHIPNDTRYIKYHICHIEIVVSGRFILILYSIFEHI